MTSQANQVQALFDRIAPVYDQLNTWLSLGQHRIWKQMTVKWSQAAPGMQCLDLCCGSGDLAQMLARVVGPTGQVVAVDFSRAQLAVAQHRCRDTMPPICWVEADALALPFPDHTFDAVTMGYGLRNVADLQLSLAELHRVLKPGAKAAILDFHHPEHPLVQSFLQWYLQYLVVPVAEQFGLGPDYAYIQASLDRFPPGSQQKVLAQAVGFQSTTHYSIAGGTMGVLVVTK